MIYTCIFSLYRLSAFSVKTVLQLYLVVSIRIDLPLFLKTKKRERLGGRKNKKNRKWATPEVFVLAVSKVACFDSQLSKGACKHAKI